MAFIKIFQQNWGFQTHVILCGHRVSALGQHRCCRSSSWVSSPVYVLGNATMAAAANTNQGV